MHRLAAHPIFRDDMNLAIFLEYDKVIYNVLRKLVIGRSVREFHRSFLPVMNEISY